MEKLGQSDLVDLYYRTCTATRISWRTIASWSTKGVKSSSTDVFHGAQQASFSPGRRGVRSLSPPSAPYAASRCGRGCWRALRPSPTACPAEKLTNKTPRIIIMAILWKNIFLLFGKRTAPHQKQEDRISLHCSTRTCHFLAKQCISSGRLCSFCHDGKSFRAAENSYHVR